MAAAAAGFTPGRSSPPEKQRRCPSTARLAFPFLFLEILCLDLPQIPIFPGCFHQSVVNHPPYHLPVAEHGDFAAATLAPKG